MKSKAAILWETGRPWSVEEIELDPPQQNEVLVRIEAAGMCHSDDHVRAGDGYAALPTIGGHEGAGVIEQVGPGIEHLAVGDHVVFSFLPACGRCRWCASGRSNLCDYGQFLMEGSMISGGYRAHARGRDVGTLSLVGTFSERTVVHETSVVKIDQDIPFEVACLLGCGVPTGWGSSVNIGKVRPGETVVVVGIGGIGANAVQGARLAGAQNIVAVDPVAFKTDQAKILGATHTAASMEEAMGLVQDITRGVMADVGVNTIGVVEGWMIQPFLDLVSKGGRAVLTGMARNVDDKATLGLQMFSLFEKSLLGTVYGGCNPRADIPRLADLYRTGKLQLDELVTRTYSLDQINEGYADMLTGKNIRGVIVNRF
ncbi:NDMA-dependent alcohol dehydrogenase [Streptomyces sp. NPDC001812]|uniref:NDMA-dependent alcohol dehydrogenase n=1 Tax=Streptomyces sp. NPDC001812 TaxID=3364611 RepID=UPI00368E6616